LTTVAPYKPAPAKAGDDGAIAMPHQRGDQAIEFTRRHQHILAAERADDPLANATALALILDEVEVAMASRRLLTDKHRLVVRNIDARIKKNSQIY